MKVSSEVTWMKAARAGWTARCGHRHAEDVHADSSDEVLPDDAPCPRAMATVSANLLQIVAQQHHIRALAGDISAGAHRDADAASANAGASLTPSPTIATTRPLASGASRARAFLGQQFGGDLVDAQCRGDGPGHHVRIAREQDGPDPHRLNARWRGGLQAGRYRRWPWRQAIGRRAQPRPPDAGLAVAQRYPERRCRDRASACGCRPTPPCRPSRIDSATGRVVEALGFLQREPVRVAYATIVLPSGCSERNSADAAASSTSASGSPGTGISACTSGGPTSGCRFCRAPQCRRAKSSRYRPPLMIAPAARPVRCHREWPAACRRRCRRRRRR